MNLWRVSSVSSAPLLELDEDEGADGNGMGGGDAGGSGGDADAQRKRMEPRLAADAAVRVQQRDHADSVMAAAWSAHNAWVYATLSYTGRVVVSQVPSAEKYKVLL